MVRREGNVLIASVCLSVHNGGGGGTPWSLVPSSFPCPGSQVLSGGEGGGYLSVVTGPAQGGQYPNLGQGYSLPPLARTGVLLPQPPGRLCSAVGMPLAFTQEDFLVYHNVTNGKVT